MWRQACPNIPSFPNPRAAILNFVKGVWGKSQAVLRLWLHSNFYNLLLVKYSHAFIVMD